MYKTQVTHSSQFHVFCDTVLPVEAEDVRKVEGEVDDAAACSCQVSLVEEHTHQKTLHDGGDGERQQEQEHQDGVAVVQHFSSLKGEKNTVLWGAAQTHNINWATFLMNPEEEAVSHFDSKSHPCPLTIIMQVSRAVLAVIMMKLSINHVYQMTLLSMPMIFIVSLSRSSFSRTMLFTVMDTE